MADHEGDHVCSARKHACGEVISTQPFRKRVNTHGAIALYTPGLSPKQNISICLPGNMQLCEVCVHCAVRETYSTFLLQ
jgi:hypothetical protein